MPVIPRRGFLRGSAAVSALLGAARLRAQPAAARRELARDPDGLLDLPQGFSYRVVQRSGERMSDGFLVPGHPDAMAVFRGQDGSLVLMRNHEVMPGDRAAGPYAPDQPPAPEAYDPEAFGGVTRVVLDPRSLQPRSSNLVLCGTHWNCAGGLSPWGWLSCEEIFAPRHGYVFLCDVNAARVAAPKRITGYGRFRHEAAAVDPRTHVAYLTEDDGDGAFYRFVPHDRRTPFAGKLQALRIAGSARFDTSTMSVGDRLPVAWVDVAEPEPSADTVRLQAADAGAARFVRAEGLWLDGDDAYLCATAGGPIGRGQIFRLTHTPAARASLQLLAHSTDALALDMPDNLTVSPQGQIYVAEDGYEGNSLRRITPAGEVVDFARVTGSLSELTGPCFTPDGGTMFVNVQHAGLTLAITGPFERELDHDRALSPAERRTDPRAGLLGLGTGLAVIALAALARRKQARG